MPIHKGRAQLPRGASRSTGACSMLVPTHMTDTLAGATRNAWLHPLADIPSPPPSERLVRALEAHVAAEDHPEIAELDCNPVIVNATVPSGGRCSHPSRSSTEATAAERPPLGLPVTCAASSGYVRLLPWRIGAKTTPTGVAATLDVVDTAGIEAIRRVLGETREVGPDSIADHWR